MDHALARQIERYFDAYETTQLELGRLFERKRQFLRKLTPNGTQPLLNEEAVLAEQLSSHVRTRREILRTLDPTGRKFSTLEAVTATFEEPARGRLAERILRLKKRGIELRRESWIQWIVTQRGARHCGELVDMVAGPAGQPLTYECSDRSANLSSGGTLLDASI